MDLGLWIWGYGYRVRARARTRRTTTSNIHRYLGNVECGKNKLLFRNYPLVDRRAISVLIFLI